MKEKFEIGPYKPDANSIEAFFFIDYYQLCLVHTDNQGKGDCIGRTLKAWLAYHDPDLVEGVANLWWYRPEYGDKMVGLRHPELEEVGRYSKGFWKNRMSRDHFVNTLVLLRLWEKQNMMKLHKVDEIIDSTPFKIRRMARWTLSLILWAKGLRNKRAEWWWLILKILVVNLVYVPLFKLGYKIAGWGEEVDQDEWNENIKYLQDQSKLNRFIDRFIFSSFALLFAAFQIYASNNSYPKLKKFLQKSYLKMVGKTNYLQQMLLGVKDVPRDKVENYKSMRGGRWSGNLNGRNDRPLYIFNPPYEYNQVDRDMLRAIYNDTQLTHQ